MRKHAILAHYSFIHRRYAMSYWQTKIKIGKLEFPRFMGAPLDGITDSPFRKVVRKFSKDALLYTEMRHIACIANDKGAAKALKFEQSERPLNYQVAANKIDFIDRACDRILEAGVDCIDLNIGCPARNVVGSGSGSSLMADLPRLEMLLKRFRERIPLPFTVKIRAGFKQKNALEVAKLIEDCGIDALAIHPRLQTQMFNGVPDYELAGLVKQAVKIPVLLSGGIVNWPIAKKVYEQTGVDGFLIGRGMWSKPWKLKELEEHSLGRPFKVENEMILQCALEHLDRTVEYYGPQGIQIFRKHLPFYIKGKLSASQLRKELVVCEDVERVKAGLIEFFRTEAP